MSARRDTRAPQSAIAIALALLAASLLAQQPSHGPVALVPPAQQPPDSTKAGQPVTLDRVVAIVNGDLILESDVDAEERFAAFQPFNEPRPVTRDQVIDRLIDRALIQQQMALQPEPPITDAQVEAQLATLRKSIPKCAAYHCETQAGWEKFAADQGFTVDEVRERWRQRMAVLRFIEDRFRMGIRVEQADIDDYYKSTMLPVYKKENVTPPAEATIADRIQEIVLQQRVNKVLDDWLTTLRAEGSVRTLKPGEEAP
jgi:hypothetical protein